MTAFSDICDSLFSGRTPLEACLSKRNVLEIPGFLALGALATLIAALVGVGIVMVGLGAISLFALMFFSAYYPLMLEALFFAMLLAAPVTFGLFPLAAYLLRGHVILVQLVVPTVGFIAGGAIMVIWFASGLLGPAALANESLVCIGMVSGLVAGAFYGAGLHP